MLELEGRVHHGRFIVVRDLQAGSIQRSEHRCSKQARIDGTLPFFSHFHISVTAQAVC